LFQEAFEDALRLAISDPDYTSVDFPDVWQFSHDIDALLNANFWENN